MCEFCTGNQNIYDNEVDGVKIVCTIKHDKIVGTVHVPLFGAQSDSIKIKYCPMCGKEVK